MYKFELSYQGQQTRLYSLLKYNCYALLAVGDVNYTQNLKVPLQIIKPVSISEEVVKNEYIPLPKLCILIRPEVILKRCFKELCKILLLLLSHFYSGSQLVPTFKRQGFHVIGICLKNQSGTSYGAALNQAHYGEQITQRDSLETYLINITPLAILPGLENGVSLAEKLC